MEITQKVVSGRRLTIPKAVAKEMDIEVGDIITVSINGVVRSKGRGK